MKNFLIVERMSEDGSNGCDYTIGCGVRVYEHIAPSMNDLLNALQKGVLMTQEEAYRKKSDEDPVFAKIDRDLYELTNGWVDGEFQRSSVRIYEIGDTTLVPLDTWGGQKRELVRKQESQEKDATERELYEKLAKKYGR